MIVSSVLFSPFEFETLLKIAQNIFFVAFIQKIQANRLGFFHLCRKAQHHLTEGQHHFEQRENIISHSFGTNERGCTVGANDVMLRINDVGLRPMMLRFAQTEFSRAFCVFRGKKPLSPLHLFPDLSDLKG